jgi:hypothetical protein
MGSAVLESAYKFITASEMGLVAKICRVQSVSVYPCSVPAVFISVSGTHDIRICARV